MDWTLILTAIGTAATVVSTIVAVCAKMKQKNIKTDKRRKSRNVTSNGDVEVTNNGNNSGVISGINSGEIRS